jgi:outer membrane protein OmpA-like peptidoglycan-associated protein
MKKGVFAAMVATQCIVALAQYVAPVANPSEDDILEALGARAGSLPKKAFRRTESPDAKTHACPEVSGDANLADTGARKNLVAVAFAADGAPSLDLAINFATNSDKIIATSFPALDNLARALGSESMRGINVAIAGHTDAQGKAQVNLQLSCARAIAIRNHLVTQGIASARLGVFGFGSTRPLEPGVEVSAINRRVEVRRAN